MDPVLLQEETRTKLTLFILYETLSVLRLRAQDVFSERFHSALF